MIDRESADGAWGRELARRPQPFNLAEDEMLVGEAEREVERLQELHRRNVLDIRKLKDAAYLDPFQAIERFDALLRSIENRSRSALGGLK